MEPIVVLPLGIEITPRAWTERLLEKVQKAQVPFPVPRLPKLPYLLRKQAG